VLPSEILKELQTLTAMTRAGVAALYDAEIKLAEAEHELDTTEARTFIASEGTVADRQALARLESADARLRRDIAKAEVNRIRVKLKGLESAMMANATMAKIMDTESRL
jgi:Tfp pilus assembly protein PilX